MKPETWAIVGGRPERVPGAPLNTPIVPASNFVLGTERLYSRTEATDTWDAFEDVLGGLEGGHAVSFSSGMAACNAVLSQLPTGAHLVIPDDCYQGVAGIAEAGARDHGWKVERVPAPDTDTWIAKLGEADVVWIESPTSPLLDVADVAAICAAPRKEGTRVVVDNTFATPLGQQPLALGADISMMSGTKTLSGHSDVLVGAVSTRDGELVEALKRWRSQSGSVIGAMEAWLVHRSLATLALRLERSSAGALAVAGALRERGIEVFHPSDHAESAQMLQYGCLVGFVLESEARAQDVLARCRLVAEATSFGGVHATAERRERWGTDDVPPGFIRYSAGIEEPEDLVADLLNAL